MEGKSPPAILDTLPPLSQLTLTHSMEGQQPPILEKLPAEIHDAIGSHLTGRELDGVTRASKRLRALFLRSIFRKVRFHSTQPEVIRSVDLFINGRSAEEMSDIWTAVRCASFTLPLSELLDVFSLEEMLPASLDPLRLQILQGIRLVSQVRRLTVDLELFGDGHVQTFRDALPMVPRWEHLHSLKMTGVDHCRELATTLIHSCSSQKLISVDIGGIFSFALAGVVQRYCKRLERLRIESPFTPANENQFPAMQYIYESRGSLRQVKWLSIVEKNPGDTGSIDAFEQCLGEMIEALQQMPNLRRFAVSMDIYRFDPSDIRDELGVDGDDDHQLTDDLVLDWYTIQIQHVASAAPQLRELCFFVRGRIYCGTKSGDGEAMRVLPDAVQPGVECTRFPWGVGDDQEYA